MKACHGSASRAAEEVRDQRAVRGQGSGFQPADSALAQLQTQVNRSPRVRELQSLRAALNHQGAVGESGHEEKESGPSSAEVMQRKIRVATSGEVFQDVGSATAATGQNCAALAGPITSGETFTVKQVNNVAGLAQGNQEQVLRPRKHVIGEVHTASQFDRITGEWPGVAAMGEGRYTVEETGLALPATRSEAHSTFETALQSQDPGILPLENYHSAAIARLLAYLVGWNEHRSAGTATTEGFLQRRTKDMVNLFNAYQNVAAGVVIQSYQSQAWWQLWRNYKGEIEKAYGEIYDLLRGDGAQAAYACLAHIKGEVDAGHAVPNISAGDYTAVRNWIAAMIPLAGKVLAISMKGKAAAAQVASEVATTSSYVKQNAATVRGAQTQTALDQIGPTRERSMAEHIQTLAKPGLVKVGKEHIAGLQPLNIADAELYDDAADFENALLKRAGDL